MWVWEPRKRDHRSTLSFVATTRYVSHVRVFSLALALCVWTQPVWAQEAEDAPAEEAAEAPQTAPLIAALRKVVAGDIEGAETDLRALVQAGPEAAGPRCELASIARRRGNLEPAVVEYRECVRLARRSNDVPYEARGLMGTLQTLERLGQLNEAREAATALLSFADAHPEAVTSERARRRLSVIDAIIELDAVAAEVRARREARAAAAENE